MLKLFVTSFWVFILILSSCCAIFGKKGVLRGVGDKELKLSFSTTLTPTIVLIPVDYCFHLRHSVKGYFFETLRISAVKTMGCDDDTSIRKSSSETEFEVLNNSPNDVL